MPKSIRQNRGLYFSILLMVIAAVTYYSVASMPEDKIDPQQLNSVLVILVVTILIVGNILIGRLLNRILTWKRFPIGRFVTQLLSSALLTIAAVSSTYTLVKQNLTDSPPDIQQLIGVNLYSLAVLLPIFSIYFGIRFIRSWRKSELEAEQLQKENARSQMNSLKNHLDPHFLFNNLNVLSSLMDTDVEASKEFLGHFSQVYRTLLRSEAEDLVTLDEELQLISSYAYLLKIRFGEGLKLNINVAEEDREKYVPPLSLQMLIENVVKHNIATKSKPSVVDITTKYDYMTVTNNIQLKPFDEKTRSGTGLDNLVARFQHFTDQKVHIHKERGLFNVHLPLIVVE